MTATHAILSHVSPLLAQVQDGANTLTYILTIAFILVSVLMILVVLVQRGRGGGVAGAFGGGGSQQSAFGTKTGDVFTTITVILFILFIGFSIGLNLKLQNEEGARQNKPAITEQSSADKAKAAADQTTPAKLPPAAETPKLPAENTSKPATAPATAPVAPATRP